MTTDLASNTPRLAILIPIFRHPSLVIEGIESVLAQRFQGGLRLLLVSDGCPLPETDQVCRDYARAYPSIITYLRKKNGGLSDARNFGVRHVLEHLPSVEAIYMLDADNRLRPDAMARAMAALDADPAADWIYPNIDMFGLEWGGDYGGDYSVLIHTEMNTCEAGSLIRRRVFEAGVFFDTEFKLGWEDWDFFLSAARKGFRGRNLEHFGFLYRKRPESMLADSERDQGALRWAMQQKHKPVLRPRKILELEQAEAPRYAIHSTDRGLVTYCVDPAADGVRTATFEAFETDYWLARSSPQRRTPFFNIILAGDVMDALREAGLLHWALWKLESMLESTAGVAVLTVGTGAEGRLSVAEVAEAGKDGRQRGAVALAISRRLIDAIVDDVATDWVDTLAQPGCKPPVTALELRLPPSSPALKRLRRPTAVFDALSLVHRLRASRFRAASARPWGHRANGIPLRGREHEIVRRKIAPAPIFPRLTDDRRHIGFLLPLVEFGGVEKVALQMARGLRAHGWVPHAFVLEATDISLTPEWGEVFESTNFLADPSFKTWGGGSQAYLSTTVPGWAQEGRHGPLLGMLHWLDAVINFHGGAAVGVMGQLRRLGIKTANSLHLNDLTPLGRPVGNTYLGLAYEHAFDLFVPCSNQLADWLHGMGVPRDKIVTVSNGPGFEIAPEVTARGIEARAARSADEPLRVLYLGRLDRQKGLDRLIAVMCASEERGLNLEWRIIGKALMIHDAPPLPPQITRILEPPISRPADLAAAYAWADVVVLLSRYEGLPLTLIEAIRAGAFVISTDVGAVAEVVRDGENGVLLAEADAVAGCVRALEAMAAAPERVRSRSDLLCARRGDMNWALLVQPLDDVLGACSDPNRLTESP